MCGSEIVISAADDKNSRVETLAFRSKRLTKHGTVGRLYTAAA